MIDTVSIQLGDIVSISISSMDCTTGPAIIGLQAEQGTLL